MFVCKDEKCINMDNIYEFRADRDTLAFWLTDTECTCLYFKNESLARHAYKVLIQAILDEEILLDFDEVEE